MKNLLLKAWDWLVWSSANPEKVSLTIKAGLPTAVLVLAQFGLNLDSDSALGLVGALLTVLTGSVAAFGFGRKLKNSL